MENLFFLIFPTEKLNKGKKENNEIEIIMYSAAPGEIERLESILNENLKETNEMRLT